MSNLAKPSPHLTRLPTRLALALAIHTPNPHNEWSPVAALEDTVSRMQRDLEELQTENRFLRTPRAPRPVPLVRQAALTPPLPFPQLPLPSSPLALHIINYVTRGGGGVLGIYMGGGVPWHTKNGGS